MKKMHKSVQVALIVMVGILIFGLIIFFSVKSLIPSQNTVTGNGIATIEVMPDTVGIYFNVETNAETSKEAADENAEIVEDLKTALILKGLEENEIETLSYSVYPEYEWKNNQNVQNGYTALHQIKLELGEERFDDIGEFTDAGVNAGAGVAYINFELSDAKQNEYKIQAIELASQDAKTKAEAVASGLGKKIGRLISVSSSDFNYYPWKVYAAGESGQTLDEAVTDIQPSTQEVSASVTAVFRIR